MTTTTVRYGAISESVLIDGVEVGHVYGRPGEAYQMGLGERVGAYKFPSRESAITAVESYAARGYWTGEIS